MEVTLLNVLLALEDARDAEAITAVLRRFELLHDCELAVSAATFAAALDKGMPSAVISSIAVDDMTAADALALVRARDPEVPFIVICTPSTEDTALELLRNGANDYVLADRLVRLGPMLERELRDVQLRQERRSLFDALRRSELRYRRIFEKAPIGVAVSTAHGTIMTMNKRFLSIFGYAREELVGVPVWHLAHPDERRPDVLPSSGQSTRYVHRYVRKDGSVVWATVTVNALAEENGSPEQLVWLVEDITAKHAAEEQLTLQALLLDSVEQAVIATDLSANIVYWNRYAGTMLGWKAEEVFGRNVFEIYSKSADQLQLIADQLRRGKSWSGEMECQKRDGSRVPCFVLNAPIFDAGGNFTGVVSVSNDLTERKRAEAEHVRLEAKLEQAHRLASLGRLAATIAHEFNNVLMGIAPFVELIRRGHDVTKAADHISRTIKRGKGITDDILRFTQPAEPVRQTFELRPWMQNLVFETRSLLPRGVHVALEMDQTIYIHGDPNQLHQTFLNLILNARDAMPQGGLLTIGVTREPPNAHFIVRDTGNGMSPETLQHIFEPLFTTKKSGTGLGLPVAHQVVTRHSGDIYAESELGRGTTFHVLLPLAEQAPAATAPLIDEPAADTHASLRLLLVEDDASVAAGLTSLLRLEGIDVTLVTTGREAMNAVRTQPFDVVVLDVGLPDLEGTIVYESIAAMRPDLPVIFSTGHADRGRLDRLLERANVAFLLKPYDSTTLLQTIREVVRTRARM